MENKDNKSQHTLVGSWRARILRVVRAAILRLRNLCLSASSAIGKACKSSASWLSRKKVNATSRLRQSLFRPAVRHSLAIRHSGKFIHRILKRSIRRGRALRKKEEAPIAEMPETIRNYLGACMLLGPLYVVVFLPVTIVISLSRDLDPVRVLLLQEITPSLSWIGLLPIGLLDYDARPSALALGVVYGAGQFTLALVVISGQMIKIITTANGLYLGFHLTRATTNFLPGLLPGGSIPMEGFDAKLAYIFLAYYISVGIPNIVAKGQYTREKFESFCSGMFGLFSGWILVYGFEEGSAIFSGALFLVSTFVCTALVEKLITPILYAFRTWVPIDDWGIFSGDRRYSWPALRSLVHRNTVATEEFRIIFLVLLAWPAAIVLASSLLSHLSR